MNQASKFQNVQMVTERSNLRYVAVKICHVQYKLVLKINKLECEQY